MSEYKHIPDVWDSLASFLWWLILLAGLFPEAFFFLLRELGQVSTRQAFTNTPWFITFAGAGFLGWFLYQRSRESGDRDDVAFGKAVQTFILALAAFLPLQIEQTPVYLHIPVPFYRNLILGMVGIKLLSWVYLAQLIMRYHLFSGHEVFRKMPLLFPSSLGRAKTAKESASVRVQPPPTAPRNEEEHDLEHEA